MELCHFCQEKKHNEKERGEKSSYSKIETQLKQFIEIDLTYTGLGRLDDEIGIAKTLETHSAVYHKKCYDKIGQRNRVGKKPCSEANSSSLAVTPHKRTKTELGTELCIFCRERDSTETFCAAAEFHFSSSTNNQHVQN